MESAYQAEMPIIGPTRKPGFESEWVIERLPTFRASLRFAVNASGFTQAELATALRIDGGDFSRMLKEPKVASRPREFPSDKLRDLCELCGTYAPLQWLAMRSGAEMVPARPMAPSERIARLEAENAELRRKYA
jgi:hypothetical protein